MNPRVLEVAPQLNQQLLLRFTSGELRCFDCRPLLVHEVYASLRDPQRFALARASLGTVSWPDGTDIDPDTLYLDSVPADVESAEAGGAT